MTDLRDDVRATFRERFDTKPVGIWSAPGRVNLIGEHTDYNQGFVLPLAIDRRTVVAAGPRDDGILRVGSTFAGDELFTEIAVAELGDARAGRGRGDWSQYPLGVAWALGEAADEGGGGADLAAVPGIDLMIDSNVPVGAGLSSSAAIECAVALALNELWQLAIPIADLARVGQRAENDFVGAPTGIMDQTASLLGKRDSVVFLDCRSLETEIVALGLADAGLELLVIDTGVTHAHETGGYAERRASCERAALLMGVDSLRDLTVDDLETAEHKLSEATFRRMRQTSRSRTAPPAPRPDRCSP